MDARQLEFFVILGIAVVLLISERVRPDVVAVLIVLALALTGILPSDKALSGFSSEPAIAIASVFVLGAGLRHTGLADSLGALVGRLAGRSLPRMLLAIMPTSAILSAFTHHVAITAVLLPVVLSLSRDRKIPASKLLMPLAIGSSLGTTITTITPSFLVASELLRQAGRPGLGFFSIAPIGLVLTVAGTLYMLLLGRFLLPVRSGARDPSQRFRLDEYLTEVRILADSPMVGKTIGEIEADKDSELAVVGSLRGGRRYPVSSHWRVHEGDLLLVRATPDELAAIREQTGLELEPVVRYPQNTPEPTEQDTAAAEQMVQAVIAPDSWLVHRTIAEINFLERFGALVLGVWRKEGVPPEKLSRTRLRAGDVLVLLGDDSTLARVASEPAFLMLAPFQGEPRRPRKAILAGLVMLATVVLAGLGWQSLAISMLLGAAAMVLVGSVTPRQAYRAVDVSMFVFVAGAIPLGAAMKDTGAADTVAHLVAGGVANWSLAVILFVLYLVVGIVVQFMGSDSATTALFGPMAIALGQSLGLAPEPFVIATAAAAVTATLTPMAHHNLVIYHPGGYRFFDYTRVGAPLTLLVGAVIALVAPTLWSH